LKLRRRSRTCERLERFPALRATRTALLDIDILTALLWPTHEHHELAHRWFGHRADAPVLFAGRPSPTEALALLGENLAHPGHEFWTDSLQVPAAVKTVDARLQGYRQLTDAYLLAHRRKGVLATFDRGLRTLAGNEFGESVEIVGTR
jgi:uncharacterized protein